MNKDQAISVLSQVAATYKGTLEDHQTIQSALELIKTLEVPAEKPKKPKEESKK